MSETVKNDSMQVGKELADLCRQGKVKEAIETLYSPDIVSIEAETQGTMPRRIQDLGCRSRQEQMVGEEPRTARRHGRGPMAARRSLHRAIQVRRHGQEQARWQARRMNIDETALYTVANGKVVQEEFLLLI